MRVGHAVVVDVKHGLAGFNASEKDNVSVLTLVPDVVVLVQQQALALGTVFDVQCLLLVPDLLANRVCRAFFELDVVEIALLEAESPQHLGGVEPVKQLLVAVENDSLQRGHVVYQVEQISCAAIDLQIPILLLLQAHRLVLFQQSIVELLGLLQVHLFQGDNRHLNLF